MTSTSVPAPDRSARRTSRFVYGCWAVMTLLAFLFILLYPDSGPLIDEWEFVPAVLGEEPFWPWLWKLHNEHRFPLPRLLWLPVVKLAGDFRAGCYLSLIGVSAVSLLMIHLAVQVRGRLDQADAFFPLSMLHVGHWENWRMGYQVVFMMNLLLACVLLRLIVTTQRENLLRRAWQTALLTLLLCGCGAGGLAFVPFMLLWLSAILLASLRSGTLVWYDRRLLGIVLVMAVTVLYVFLYLQGFERPGHHQNPRELWGSTSQAAWQGLRSGMQALAMGFGPAVGGLWPASAFILGLVTFECITKFVRVWAEQVADRPRVLGMLLYMLSMLLMAYGIGWSRSVFLTPEGGPGFMGMSCRYGWIIWPFLAVIYFQWLLFGTAWQSKWIPLGFLFAVLAMLPFNVVTGIFYEGEPLRNRSARWEQAVRSGLSDTDLVDAHSMDGHAGSRESMLDALPLLRQHRFLYYAPLEIPKPSQKPERRRP